MTPANFPYEVFRASALIDKDLGNGSVQLVRGAYQTLGLEIAAANETRFIPAPVKSGLRYAISVLSLAAGGSAKVAIGSTGGVPSTTFDGTNKYVTLNGFGQFIEFVSVPATALGATHQWVLPPNQGVSLSPT